VIGTLLLLTVLLFTARPHEQSGPCAAGVRERTVGRPSICDAPPEDADTASVLSRIREEEIGVGSQVMRLAQVLTDSIGPRLVGTGGLDRAADWVLGSYGQWGIGARRVPFGTWVGWDPGRLEISLLTPRRQPLVARLPAWGTGTNGPIEGPVVVVPIAREAPTLADWVGGTSGAFVALWPAEPTCRARADWGAISASYASLMEHLRAEGRQEFSDAIDRWGGFDAVFSALAAAGARGVFRASWAGGWGADRLAESYTDLLPFVQLSCEDYGLVHRLATHGQGPRVSVNVTARRLEPRSVSNVIATIPGSERAGEFVVLSAHLDSWHAGTGATDNGSGTVIVMEAMRILRELSESFPRTIIAGHWGSEELGLLGSGAYAEDHPDILDGTYLVLNQDNGTGRISSVDMQGLAGAGRLFRKWVEEVEGEIESDVAVIDPGQPEAIGSDHTSFACRGVPAFRLRSEEHDYRPYTWHTSLDTFDKLVEDDLRFNAMVLAMLTYLAATEDAPMDRRMTPGIEWPTCPFAVRRSGGE